MSLASQLLKNINEVYAGSPHPLDKFGIKTRELNKDRVGKLALGAEDRTEIPNSIVLSPTSIAYRKGPEISIFIYWPNINKDSVVVMKVEELEILTKLL